MTYVWLVAIDGSPASLRAVDYVLHEAADGSPLALHLLNVQPPLPRDITRFVDASVIEGYHREAGQAALANARRKIEAAGLAHAEHVLVGECAPAIVDFAREHHCMQIVMGARGLGTVAGLLLGSVTQRVVHLTTLPVVIVK